MVLEENFPLGKRDAVIKIFHVCRLEVEEDAVETVHSCQASQLGNIPDPTVKLGDFQDTAASSHC